MPVFFRMGDDYLVQELPGGSGHLETFWRLAFYYRYLKESRLQICFSDRIQQLTKTFQLCGFSPLPQPFEGGSSHNVKY